MEQTKKKQGKPCKAGKRCRRLERQKVNKLITYAQFFWACVAVIFIPILITAAVWLTVQLLTCPTGTEGRPSDLSTPKLNDAESFPLLPLPVRIALVWFIVICLVEEIAFQLWATYLWRQVSRGGLSNLDTLETIRWWENVTTVLTVTISAFVVAWEEHWIAEAVVYLRLALLLVSFGYKKTLEKRVAMGAIFATTGIKNKSPPTAV